MKTVFALLVGLFSVAGTSTAWGAVVDQIHCVAELTSVRGHTAKAHWNSDILRRKTTTQISDLAMTEGNLIAQIRLQEEDLTAIFRLNYLHATETASASPRSAQIACMTGALMQGEEEFPLFGCPEWMKNDVFGPDTYWSLTTATKGYEDFDASALSVFDSDLSGLATLKVDCQHLGTLP